MNGEHPQALTLTLLLTAEPNHEEGLEYAAYRVLENYLGDWPDEKLADLYSMIAERFDPKMPLSVRRATLSRLLWDNENNWASRHG